MNAIANLFRIDAENRELMEAQLAAFSRQVPLLYFILSVNSVALAFTHYGVAPISLTVVLPGLLVGACAIRCLIWLRRRGRAVEPKEAARTLRTTVVLGGILGFAFLSWALSLFPYGDTARHDHVLFFVGITVVSCIFCLMHVRPAALMLTGMVVAPFVIFLIASGDTVQIAIGLNLLLVTFAMVYILTICSRQFAAMVNGEVETRRLSNENFRLANVDSLTNLPNRRQFFHRLTLLAEQARTENRRFVVGVLDLDGFKAVNDLYGHGVGDRVLQAAGQRLMSFSDDTHFIARLGGDEFGIIIDADLDSETILAAGTRVCSALDAPFSVAGIVAQIGGSVGFALAPDAGTTAELLYERADYALYHAKAKCRGQPVIFSHEHEVEIRRLSTIEHTLRTINLEAELSLHFQPIVNVGTGRLIGFEALARWHNSELGNVPPDVFIAVAERTELIGTITQVLLRKALVAARSWPEDLILSFNLSMCDLVSHATILRIVSMIRGSDINPHRIIVEVTETALMQDYEQVQDSLRILRALGLKVALDDFGSGQSSLSYVHQLSLDKIKIDRGFIRNIATQENARNIVKTVIDLCRNLKFECVVEGVETAEQAEIIGLLGCSTMQGYFFAKPMPQSEVEAFIANHCLQDNRRPVAAAG
ncbi:putative bifunctional diguanylate cyclase/phosphodiesterase [Bradyrhizobium roseum]|uniref:putative bifunctional diguanylate cyclase/phosphodiesterase n=1 Tax=Bradyrhizobium roseum TaxID=3056648 RepID=UPI00261E2336|nr:EAL domain-containing protein [Bradyrhizobium roseus]WKA31282.1 EAL domain-containing protein [Bradyrhizobium roseus]